MVVRRLDDGAYKLDLLGEYDVSTRINMGTYLLI